MANKKTSVNSSALFSIKETGDVSNIYINELWQTRIAGTIEHLKNHWNGWTSWKNAYALDRAVTSACSKPIKSNFADVEEVTVPLIATHIRNLIPFLYSRNPEFFAIPMGDDDKVIQDAYAQQDYLNAVWREKNMDKQAKRSILDCGIIGHGIIKTGWGLELEPVTVSDEGKKGNINYRDYISDESPYIRRVNPFMFLYDRFAPEYDLASARWCCEIVIHSAQDLVDNDFYNPNVRKMIEDGNIPLHLVSEFKKEHDSEENLYGPDKSVQADTSPDDLCLVYRVYDRKFKNIFTLIPGYHDHILSLHSWDKFYGHLPNFPFRKVDFEEIPNEINGMGHAHYLADLQAQIQRNRNKIFGITRMFNPKWIYAGNKPMSSSAKYNLERDDAGIVIDLAIGSSLLPLETPKVSTDLYQAANMLSTDYSEISGSDILSRGGLLPSRTSAQEIKERRRLRGLRLETNVNNTHAFLLDIGKDIIRYAKAFASKSMVVEVTNRPGISWANVSSESLKNSNVAIHLDVVSREEQSPEVIRQHLLSLFQQIANPNILQLLQQANVPVNIGRLWDEIIRTFNIASLRQVFPTSDISQIQVQNPGNQPNIPTGDTTQQLQTDNVDSDSILQGFLQQQGNLTPTNF